MRAVIVRQAEEIAPFARPPDGCGLGSGTFGSYRERTLARMRLASEEAAPDDEVEGPALLIADDVWVTRRALRAFAGAVGDDQPARLALPASRLLELFLPLQDVPVADDGRAAFDVAYVPAGQRMTARDAFALPEDRWRTLPFREIKMPVPLPHHLMGRDDPYFTFPLTTTIAMRVRHWLHVLRAGHLAPQVELIEGAESRPVASALRAALAFLLPGETTRGLRRRFVWKGKGVYVHPTATVEASVLGDGVTVGAYSYITGSVLGPGCTVEQRAHVEQSSLGPRTFVSKNSSLSAMVAFGDTDVCTNGVQTCVVAERCGLTSWARPLDLVPGGEVRVLDGDEARGVGELPCGAAFGEGVFVGAGVTIAPGRSIPAGVRLVADPAHTLRKVADDATPGDTLAVVDGTARKVD
jgi:carbonic anhydrase/acetyltransferase-like protein (isoleucine patch superfamily)